MLHNLHTLRLNCSYLTQLPCAIGNMRNLITLELRENSLINLPDSICDLENLVHLDLEGIIQKFQLPLWIKLKGVMINRLWFIAWIFPGFDHSNFSSGQNFWAIERFEWSDYLRIFRWIKIFGESKFSVNQNFQWIIFEWIKDNHITHLPDDFGSLTSLSELMLDKNELTHLPISFGHLKSLTWVDLCSNLIENLPENLYQLTNLEIFNLSKNFLEEIPASIGSMKKLSILKVDQNKLLDLTSAVGDCINLTELVLNENLLTRIRSDTFLWFFCKLKIEKFLKKKYFF